MMKAMDKIIAKGKKIAAHMLEASEGDITFADGKFSVAIIPYTWEFTNMKNLQKGDVVNLEFDIIGKYVAKLLKSQKSNLIEKHQ